MQLQLGGKRGVVARNVLRQREPYRIAGFEHVLKRAPETREAKRLPEDEGVYRYRVDERRVFRSSEHFVEMALAQRVDLSEERSFTARYPAEQPVSLRIVMKDGTAHTGECVVTKGEPANPHKPEELPQKFCELGEPVWGHAVTRALYEGLMQIEDISVFRAFANEFTL